MRGYGILLAGLLGGLIGLPALAQAPTTPLLPAGHPEIPPMAPAATQPSSHGSVLVHVQQGTRDAPLPAGATITLDLRQQDRIIRRFEARLDEKGSATFQNIPLSLPFQPVISIVHQGVGYQAAGGGMDADHPHGHVDVTVYEATEQAPPWHLHMRHVILAPLPEGLKVTEMLAVANPSDRTWIGTPGAGGARSTLIIPLPEGAQQIETSGALHPPHVRIEGNKLVSSLPLEPGPAHVQLSYFVPGKDGKAAFSVLSPATVQRMALFVPPEGASVTVSGLEDNGVQEMGNTRSRKYSAANLPAGHLTTITATLPAQAVKNVAAASQLPKIIAGVGAGLALVVGVIVVLLKSPKPASTTPATRKR